MHRSVTDLTVDISEEVMSTVFGGSMEIQKEQVKVNEIEIVQMDKQLVMVVIMSNGKVLAYKNIREF